VQSLLLLSLCAIVKARRGESALFLSRLLFFSRREEFESKNKRTKSNQSKRKTQITCERKINITRAREREEQQNVWSDDESAEAKNGSERFVGRDCE